MYKVSDYFVTSSNLKSDILVIIREFLPKAEVDDDFTISEIKGGTSNVLYLVCIGYEQILFRIYGDIPLNRKRETDCMSILAKHDLASKVLGKFKNGVAYYYIEGSVIDLESLYTKETNKLVIKEMAKLHSIDENNFAVLENEKVPMIYEMIKEFLDRLPNKLNDEVKNKKFQIEYPSKEKWLDYLKRIQVKLDLLNPPIAFTHNDLLHRNILINSSKDRVHFIDYEYCGFNYCAFDIGNFFNEFAGLENPDYSFYPKEGFQKWWIKDYLNEMLLLNPENCNYHNINNDLVNTWYEAINLCALLSMMLWSVWNVYQDINSKIEFDFMKLAYTRFDDFLRRTIIFL